jgi:hypothetical protein
MTNLLEETLESIEETKHSTADVVWVGSANGTRAIAWDEFTLVADINYDSGYGGNEIPLDLVLVFSDGSWLQRGEYDGAEWWDFCNVPTREATASKFKFNVVETRHDRLGGWMTRDVDYESV